MDFVLFNNTFFERIANGLGFLEVGQLKGSNISLLVFTLCLYFISKAICNLGGKCYKSAFTLFISAISSRVEKTIYEELGNMVDQIRKDQKEFINEVIEVQEPMLKQLGMSNDYSKRLMALRARNLMEKKLVENNEQNLKE